MSKIDEANRNANKLDIKDIPDPMDVLEEASKGPTPQARFQRNPYAYTAVMGYDYVRFEHRYIQLLEVMLIDLAIDRRWKGKKTTNEFLIQEALRLGKEIKEKGVPHYVSSWWRRFGKDAKPEDFQDSEDRFIHQ